MAEDDMPVTISTGVRAGQTVPLWDVRQNEAWGAAQRGNVANQRLTRGSTVDEAGSALTGVTDENAAAGTFGNTMLQNPNPAGGPGHGPPFDAMDRFYNPQNPPPFTNFYGEFFQRFPQAPKSVMEAAGQVFTTLRSLYSFGAQQPNGEFLETGWHPASYDYDFGEFVRDVAVAAAARGRGAMRPSSGSEMKATRLTRGTTQDEAGSRLTGITDEDAAAGYPGNTRAKPARPTPRPRAGEKA